MGEVGESGKACGQGKAVHVEEGTTYEGSFLNDQPHGVCKLSSEYI